MVGARTRRFRGLAGIDSSLLQATCLAPPTRRAEPLDASQVAAMIEMFGSLTGLAGRVASEPERAGSQPPPVPPSFH